MGFETLVVAGSPEPDEGDMADDLVAAGGTFIRIPEMTRSIHPFRDFKALLRLRKVVREFKPAILHTHTAKAGFLGRLAASPGKRDPLLVHTFHGHVLDGYFGSLRSSLYRWIERALARRTDAIVAVSSSTHEELVHDHGVGKASQYRIIPSGFPCFNLNGTETMREELGLEGDLVAGMVGRLVPVKGPDVLLRAMPGLLERIPNLKILVVGDGPMRGSLEAWARSSPAKEAIRFTGVRRDMARVFKTLDILVHPSFKEGLPTVVLEAAAANVPVVASRIPGVLDLLEDGKSALLFEPGSPEELCGAVIRLAKDAGLRQRLASEALRSMSEKIPDYEGVAWAHARLYNELMERRSG